MTRDSNQRPTLPHMDRMATVLQQWHERLGELVASLQQAAGQAEEVRREISDVRAIAEQYLLLAGIDEPFLVQLLRDIDESTLTSVLRRSTKRTRRKVGQALEDANGGL